MDNDLLTDLQNGRKEPAEAYEDLRRLEDRKSSAVRVSQAGGDSKEDLYREFSFSMPLAQLSKLTEKTYGYMRDGNIEDDLLKLAIMGSHSLSNLIMDAPCLNRVGRYQEEEDRAQQLEMAVDAEAPPGPPQGFIGPGQPHPTVKGLLHLWSQADAFMLQALIYELKHGIDASTHLYDRYSEMKEQRESVELEAADLTPSANLLFWTRLRQLQIQREQVFDLAMGRPTYDVTSLKRDLATGANIHDVHHRMPWPFQEGYQAVMGSMLDGQEHRLQQRSLAAQQHPPAPMPWPMPGGFWPGQPGADGQAPDGDGEDGPPDKRPALFNIFRGKNGQQQQEDQKKPNIRRKKARSNRK